MVATMAAPIYEAAYTLHETTTHLNFHGSSLFSQSCYQLLEEPGPAGCADPELGCCFHPLDNVF